VTNFTYKQQSFIAGRKSFLKTGLPRSKKAMPAGKRQNKNALATWGQAADQERSPRRVDEEDVQLKKGRGVAKGVLGSP
jgi:hypothetical protein